MGPAWTGDTALPDGAMQGTDFDAFLAGLTRQKPFLPPATARRLARAYGTRVHALLGNATALADLGETFEGGLTAAEVDCLRRYEWALSADDILWRRSKLGLHTTPDGVRRLEAYLARVVEAACRLVRRASRRR